MTRFFRAALVALALAAGSLSTWAQDVTADVHEDFNFTTLNTTNLAANDHTSDCTWSITDANSRLSTSASAEMAFTGLIGSNSDSGGTHGLRYDSPVDFQQGTITCEFASSHATVSFGFGFRFPAEYVGTFEGGQPDILYVENATATRELYIKLYDDGTSHIALFTPEQGYAPDIDVEPDTDYWITAGYGPTHTIEVRELATGTLVGSQQTRTGTATAATQASLGNLIGDEGGGGPFDFDDWVMDWTDATFPLGPPIATGSTEQEGFRWGVDDGNEAAHTFEAAQDTNITIADNQSRLLRVLINGTDDPASVAYTLRYQKNGSGGYVAVPVGASTIISPTPEAADVTESGNNTASTSWALAFPAYVSGDLISCHVASDADVTHNWPATGPNGETINTIQDSVGGTAQRGSAFWWVGTATTGASTITVTPSATEQWTGACLKVPAGEFNSTTPIQTNTGTANDTTADTSAATPTWSTDATANGRVMVWFAFDVVQATAAPMGWQIVESEDRGATGGTLGMRDALNTASESVASANFTIASETDTSIGYVINSTTVTNEVYIATSANIAAGGEATTARLTAPAGKTTSDFVCTTNCRWDDENGIDTTDITTDDYAELEPNVFIASSAADGDFFDFRYYAGANALDTYTVTPRWTIPSAGGGVMPLRRRHAALLPEVDWRAAANDDQYAVKRVVGF